MKRITALIAAVLLTVLLFSSCSEAKKTAKDAADEIATIASQAKDNLEDMVDNGTVSDGDGFINEDNKADKESVVRETVSDHTDSEEVTEYYEKGIFDGVTENTDESDFI